MVKTSTVSDHSSRHSHLHDYSSLIMSIRLRKRLHLLYLLVVLNIIFFLLVYHRLILITPLSNSASSIDKSVVSFIEKNFVEEQTDEKISSSSVCYIPRFDPWDQSVAKLIRIRPPYRCPTNKQHLIHVFNNTQLVFNQTNNRNYFDNSVTHCVYLKVGRNPEEKYFRDWSYTLSQPILIDGYTEPILDADFVVTRCYNTRTGYFNGNKFW